MKVSLAQIETGLRGLAGIDFPAALVAFQASDFDAELVAVEDVLSVIGIFVPEALALEKGLEVLGLINKAREMGLWVPGQPEDPAMARAAGHSSGR